MSPRPNSTTVMFWTYFQASENVSTRKPCFPFLTKTDFTNVWEIKTAFQIQSLLHVL
jgi:hypothetical protein